MCTPKQSRPFTNNDVQSIIEPDHVIATQACYQGTMEEGTTTSERAEAYVSALSWPETVKNAGFPKKSWQQKKKTH